MNCQNGHRITLGLVGETLALIVLAACAIVFIFDAAPAHTLARVATAALLIMFLCGWLAEPTEDCET